MRLGKRGIICEIRGSDGALRNLDDSELMRKGKNVMKILIGYDGSDCANAALDDLRRAGLPAKAEVVVLTAADVFLPPDAGESSDEEPTSPDYVPRAVKLAWERARRAFEEAEILAARASERLRVLFPQWKITPEAQAETPHWAIILKANEWKPDLVVVGSHGRSGLGRVFFGSVSQKVLHELSCSVRIARGRHLLEPSPIRLILAADGSPDAEAMLNMVISRRWPKATQVKLITVAEPFDPDRPEPDAHMNRIRDIQKLAERKLKKAGLDVIPFVSAGDAKSIIVREAEKWQADCVFLGAQGHRFLERMLLGSVSSSVAARAHCSVEVIRGNRENTS